MPVNTILANRVREAIASAGEIEEKTMFSGMCFMLNGKMCICVKEHEIMCRIGPQEYMAALEKPGCRPMVQNGKTMAGFVFVSEGAIQTKKEFDYWVNAALAFNREAKASKSKKKK